MTRAFPLILLLALSGCATDPPVIATSTAPRAAAHLYVTRPLKAIPEPDPFIKGAIVAFSEAFVLAGYDFTGTTLDPEDEGALLDHLAQLNEKVPGTVGVHLVFVEAPVVVGFGTARFGPTRCTVYDSNNQIVLFGKLDPPEQRDLVDLLRPLKRPDVAGRYWGQRAWRKNLSYFFPPRG